MNRMALTIATWFGCGYFPWGPGTVGSMAAILISALRHTYLFSPSLVSLTPGSDRIFLAVAVVVLTGPAIWAATRTAALVGREDPGLVVVDEVLGQWVTLLGATVFNWKSWVAALVLFRLFDIWKPWPVRTLERLPAGVGIVCDDLAAGIYGALILYIGGIFRLY